MERHEASLLVDILQILARLLISDNDSCRSVTKRIAA
jgi:hypothetical protein